MIELPAKEKIIILKRRHWIVLCLQIAGATLVFLFLGAGIFLGRQSTPQWNSLWSMGLMLAFSLFWLILWLVIVDYFLDVWIVTDKRILDIEQKGLFNREVSEFKLERIQDVTVDTKGILQTFLRYGDVHIETAGEEREFVFEQVPNPHQVKDQILKLYDQRIKKSPLKNLAHQP